MIDLPKSPPLRKVSSGGEALAVAAIIVIAAVISFAAWRFL